MKTTMGSALTLVLLLLLGVARANIMSVTASMTPTGGSGISSQKITLIATVTILEDYSAAFPSFTTLLQFAGTGFIGSSNYVTMSSTVTVDGSTDSYPVYGYDTSAASVMQYNHILTFAKGKTFTIKVSNLNYVAAAYKNNYLLVLLSASGTSTSDDVILTRVYVPFYTDSSVTSNNDSTVVTSSFVSPSGFLASGYLVYTFPSCMKVQDQTLVSCASVSWVVAGSNMGSTTCLSSSNSMAVRRTSALTNGSSVAFSINLASSHTCTSTDYVYVSLYETNGNRQIEYATLRGINTLTGSSSSNTGGSSTTTSSGSDTFKAGLAVLLGLALFAVL